MDSYNFSSPDDGFFYFKKHGAGFGFLIAVPFTIFVVLGPWLYNRYHDDDAIDE